MGTVKLRDRHASKTEELKQISSLVGILLRLRRTRNVLLFICITLISLLSLQHVLPFTCITEKRFTFYMYNIRGYFSDMHDFFKITLASTREKNIITTISSICEELFDDI